MTGTLTSDRLMDSQGDGKGKETQSFCRKAATAQLPRPSQLRGQNPLTHFRAPENITIPQHSAIIFTLPLRKTKLCAGENGGRWVMWVIY